MANLPIIRRPLTSGKSERCVVSPRRWLFCGQSLAWCSLDSRPSIQQLMLFSHLLLQNRMIGGASLCFRIPRLSFMADPSWPSNCYNLSGTPYSPGGLARSDWSNDCELAASSLAAMIIYPGERPAVDQISHAVRGQKVVGKP